MNVVDLVNNSELYIGQEITLVGTLDRPRKKHSSYLFFNLEDSTGGIQVVVKQDLLGKERFKTLIYGLCQKDRIKVNGILDHEHLVEQTSIVMNYARPILKNSKNSSQNTLHSWLYVL